MTRKQMTLLSLVLAVTWMVLGLVSLVRGNAQFGGLALAAGVAFLVAWFLRRSRSA